MPWRGRQNPATRAFTLVFIGQARRGTRLPRSPPAGYGNRFIVENRFNPVRQQSSRKYTRRTKAAPSPASDPRGQDIIFEYLTINSMRRFCAIPSSVVLGACRQGRSPKFVQDRWRRITFTRNPAGLRLIGSLPKAYQFLLGRSAQCVA